MTPRTAVRYAADGRPDRTLPRGGIVIAQPPRPRPPRSPAHGLTTHAIERATGVWLVPGLLVTVRRDPHDRHLVRITDCRNNDVHVLTDWTVIEPAGTQ